MDPTKQIRKWAYDPESFCREALFVEPTDQQIESLDAIKDLVAAKIKSHEKGKLTKEEKSLAYKLGISIMSGRGTGKDAFASWMIIWFLCCFPYPKVPCTATSSKQLKQVLWAEIAKWLRFSSKQAKAKGLPDSYPNEVLTHQAEILYFNSIPDKKKLGKEWFAVPRTVNVKGSSEEQAETLSGYHEDFQMFVIDEASGIPEPVFKPIEGTLTGKCNFVLMIFNPTQSSGFAIDSQYKSRDQWTCLQWDAEQCERVSREHIERYEKKYGRDSNAFRINIKGLPPHAEPDTLIPWDWVMAAVDRDIEVDDDWPMQYGVDVARQGDDKSIILKRKGNVVEEIQQFSKIDTMELAGWVSMNSAEDEPDGISIDVIGVGAGVYDRLREMGKYNVHSVAVSMSPRDGDKFVRLRDELWWKVRERFEKGLISIPNDDELIGELTTIKFATESNGKIKVEGKKDMKKRGLMSPNKADALCLSYANDDRMFVNTKKSIMDAYKQTEVLEDQTSWMAA